MHVPGLKKISSTPIAAAETVSCKTQLEYSRLLFAYVNSWIGSNSTAIRSISPTQQTSSIALPICTEDPASMEFVLHCEEVCQKLWLPV